jgi:hypothetical protein
MLANRSICFEAFFCVFAKVFRNDKKSKEAAQNKKSKISNGGRERERKQEIWKIKQFGFSENASSKAIH